jgi:hypothetical protein
MNSRLIPWCLAATGFLAALCVFTWQGELRAPGQRVPLHAAVGHPVTSPVLDHPEIRSSQAPAASDELENAALTQSLPLPPTTQPEPDPNAQPVPEDVPTVDDLPARRSDSDSPEDE